MALRAVFFDVGETLVDEEGYWRLLAEEIGVGPHVLWAALGVTIAREEDHTALWQHLRIERPAMWDALTYASSDLYPDAIGCLERLRQTGLFVGIVGNQTSALERWAREEELPADYISSSASWGSGSRHLPSSTESWRRQGIRRARSPTSGIGSTTT